jgi:subtilisin family serine protease
MKKNLFSVLMITVLIMVTVFGSVVAQTEEPPLEPLYPAPSAETGEMINETPQLWFVELASKPTVEGTSKAVLDKEKANFRSEARKAGVVFKERYAFSTLWNGLSIQISPKDFTKLSRIPGVKAIYPVEAISIPETNPIENPELATAIAMTGADIAQNELGYTGKGVKVAVMDTGIDYDHPDLGSCFGPGCRVFKGYDFVGDAFNADPSSATYNPVTAPDPDPDDCNGHGTHVAGIIGANGEVVGVAPDVTFGAYRVFGCEGSTTADIMMMAMERALADGMQILNMSIGSAFQWPQYPTAQAADRLVNKGMVVVASIGNSGTSGLYAAGAPGLGQKVIGVASFDNTHVALNTFTISPDDYSIGYAPASGAPLPPTSGTLPMARTGTPTTVDDACAPIAADLTGHAVLIRRGTCAFHIKALNAQIAGAAAVVLYNNSAGRFSPTVAGTPAITIPVVAISDAEGVLINNRLAAGPVDLTWTDQYGTFVNPTGGLISSFSSYGLSPDLALKPDIAAPGGLIRSTYPLESGGYATISGTSMSSPHVAGGVALLLQAKPKTPAAAVRGILQNSADPKNWWGNPALGFLDMVHRQGAGMLDIPQAILSTTKIEPAKLSLGESDTGPYTTTVTVENSSKMPVTYTLSHTPALSTGPNTFTVGATTGFASVAFSAPSVTVPAGGKASVSVTITANPGLADLSQYGGYLVFTAGDEILRVPYAGLKGDYQSKAVLTSGGFGFPLLGWSTNGISFGVAGAGDVFTMQGFDIPFFLVHLDHQSRLFRVEIFDADTGKAWQRAYNDEYVGRNSTSTGFFAFPFDGYTLNGNKVNMVPDGNYVAKLSVLKALGDSTNPAHWETWTSPMFTIDRP